MSNVLKEVQALIAPGKQTAKVGIVTSKGAGGMLTVQTSSGTAFQVAGIAQVNDTVLFDDSQVVCLLKREAMRTYYI
jgi:hypothetical protein